MDAGKRERNEEGYKKRTSREFTFKGNKTGNEVILEYLKQENVAAWYRGTSHFHIQGAAKLFNALRDDGEQKTTHRVRTCLNMIGLKPMITSKQITFLMRISRGNDLVFLWFLMEMHYKTPKHDPKSYSINEQLICTAICSLDMVTTLRELDKLLPRGNPSKLEMERSGMERKREKEAALNSRRTKKNESKEYVLPYFERYPRLKHYGKRLYLEEPFFKAQLHFYGPNIVEQNESNPWYANYHFHAGKRNVHIIINEIIRNIFYNAEEISLRLKTTEVLCDYHKTLKIMAADFEHELRVNAKNACLEFYFGKNEAASQKVKKRLDEAIQQQMCRFKEQSKNLRKNSLMGTVTSDEKVFDVILGSNENSICTCNCNRNCNCKANKSSNINTNRNTNTKETAVYDEVNLKMSLPKANFANKIYNNCPFNENVPSFTNQNANNNVKKESNAKLKMTFDETEKRDTKVIEANSNVGGCSFDDTINPSDAVFKCPSKHKPFKFDYKKIFGPKSTDDQTTCIRKMFLNALTEKSPSNLLGEAEQSEHSDLIYDEAIKDLTKKMFDEKVREYEAHQETLDAANTESFKVIKEPSITFVFDADDFPVMENMLFEAFQHLRKNPKFVWAQLPDAHRIPFLREWIARRYGRVYTPSERSKSFRMSCVIFRALQKSDDKLKLPTANDIGKNFFLDYNCRNYVERKMKSVRNKFYHRLDSHILDHTRIFWFAIRGYLCSLGPPRKSFFSYLPSRQQDIHHFRLWKSTEFRDNWNAWNSRCRKKEAENL